jgi:hypothetical protein
MVVATTDSSLHIPNYIKTVQLYMYESQWHSQVTLAFDAGTKATHIFLSV